MGSVGVGTLFLGGGHAKMKKTFVGLLAVTTLVLAGGNVAHGFSNATESCSACHLNDPTVSVTVSPGGCINGQRFFTVSVSNTYQGAEGWAVFDPVNNIRNGYGTMGSFGLGMGTYRIYGVSAFGSWQTADLGGSNSVWAVSNCPSSCTDQDLDGYRTEGGTCGPVDCNDNDATIFPTSHEIKFDGIDQNCDGYDLTITITKVVYDARRTKLTVTATSDFGSSANLQLYGFGPMAWNKKLGAWTLTVITSPKPATVVVTGFEGAESAYVP